MVIINRMEAATVIFVQVSEGERIKMKNVVTGQSTCHIPTTVIPLLLMVSSNWTSSSLSLKSVRDLYGINLTGMAYGLRFLSSSGTMNTRRWLAATLFVEFSFFRYCRRFDFNKIKLTLAPSPPSCTKSLNSLWKLLTFFTSSSKPTALLAEQVPGANYLDRRLQWVMVSDFALIIVIVPLHCISFKFILGNKFQWI